MLKGNAAGASTARLLPILLLAAALAAAVGGWLLVRGRGSAGFSRRLEEHLGEADYSLSLGYLDRAETYIREAVSLARGETDGLRVLKRAFQLARRTGDFRLLAELGGRALERIRGSDRRGSDRLRLLTAYAHLRAGNLDRAERLLGGNGRSGLVRREPAAATVWAEAALTGSAEVPADAQKALPAELAGLLAAEPSLEPAELAGAGRRLQEPRLLLDAALLAMRRGKPEEAFGFLVDHAGPSGPAGPAGPPRAAEAAFSEAAFLIAYDAGETEEALRRLEWMLKVGPPRRDFQAMRGDLLALTGGAEEAEQAYLRLIREAPEFSWKPYLNLAWVLEKIGDADSARFWRQKAADAFPSERRALLSLIRDLRRGGGAGREGDAALRRWEEEYARRYPDDLETGLIRLAGAGERVRSGAYQARLWGLFHRFPADERLCRMVALHLLAAGDPEGAGAALKVFQEASGEGRAPWQLELRGILAAMEGRFEEAVEQLGQALDRQSAAEGIQRPGGRPDAWRLRYNRGVAAAAAGLDETAMEDLRRAQAILQSLWLEEPARRRAPQTAQAEAAVDEERRILARIHTRLAELLARRGDTLSARRELRYARELDPSDLKAGLLLKKLEEGSEK